MNDRQISAIMAAIIYAGYNSDPENGEVPMMTCVEEAITLFKMLDPELR